MELGSADNLALFLILGESTQCFIIKYDICKFFIDALYHIEGVFFYS